MMGDQKRATAPAQGRACGKHAVLVAQIAVGMAGKLGDIESALHGPGVQGLDVVQDRRRQFRPGVGNQAVHQGIENIGVVRTWRIAQTQGIHVCFSSKRRAATSPQRAQAA